MDNIIKKSIYLGFYVLFLLTPLLLYPYTSEIFEFNKMVFVYLMTSILVGLWIIRMIAEKRIIFKRTALDIPILVFISSQILSTLFSIDPRTSIYGYYSRFNGGLLSIISYSILYWVFVSNMEKSSTRKSIVFLFASTVLSSIWAILEHFGHSFSCLIFPDFGTFDVSCWIQDVQNRVYSTFGQPNWLAAWLVALIPLTWSRGMSSNTSKGDTNIKTAILKNLPWTTLFIIFFATLIFTKSRSGILAFTAMFFIFWLLIFYSTTKAKKTLKVDLKHQSIIPGFLLVVLVILVTVMAFGTPWTPTVSEIMNKKPTQPQTQPKVVGPALETGGTESGKIREIVWKGALDIWKHYPIFGSGVETFAFSYYQYRPAEHNLVSEWDYLYNKAHNEYLNYTATTGVVGIVAYLFLIAAIVFLIFKNALPRISLGTSNNKGGATKNSQFDALALDANYTSTALLSGFVSILITNFFGFSVVPVALLFYLFPAMSVGLNNEPIDKEKNGAFTTAQKSMSAFTLAGVLFFTILIYKYWSADINYARGKLLAESGDYTGSFKILSELVQKVPKEPLYWEKLGDVTTAVALSYSKEEGNESIVLQLAQSAISESSQAVTLSPANVNLKRNLAANLVRLSPLQSNYMLLARKTLDDAIKQAPTDPKLLYNLSYSYLATGDYDNAISNMEKAIALKPNYEKGRYALALLYEDVDKNEKAIENLKYILTNINPDNSEVKRELDEIGK